MNPWMTKEILKLQKSRDLLKEKWIKSGHIANSPEHRVSQSDMHDMHACGSFAKKIWFIREETRSFAMKLDHS